MAILSEHLIGSFAESIESYNDISNSFEKRREKILRNYSLDRIVAKYMNIFSGIIG